MSTLTRTFGLPVLLLATSAIMVPAQASLLGDEIFFQGCFPSVVNCTVPFAQIVTSDNNDGYTFGNSFTDVNADSIVVDLDAGYTVGIEFNGIRITDLNWVEDPQAVILGVVVDDSDVPGVTVSIIDGGHGLTIDVGTAVASISGLVHIDLITSHSLVPLPAALPLLFGALMGLRAVAGGASKNGSS